MEKSDRGVTSCSRSSREAVLGMYRSIEEDCIHSFEKTGVAFGEEHAEFDELNELRYELIEKGARVRNGGASIALGPLSRACVACTDSCVSRSFAITNNCHRDCYYCFNPNQKDFAYYCEYLFPWRKQLEDLSLEKESPTCIALTGGEPLLEPEESCAFFRQAKELFPLAHLRIYTSGDLLTHELLIQLREAGLDEIRFSIKPDDPAKLRELVLSKVKMARAEISSVLVEMPIIPGTEEYMKELMLELDSLGIDGMNLLEFVYPMWNWEVYESLGMVLKNPPYRVYFDYSYAGTLPIQGSEKLCLSLMLWAHSRGIRFGMHYCSLENKHRAQIRNINEPYADVDSRYAFDYGDYFLKTALVFGKKKDVVCKLLEGRGCKDYVIDEACDLVSFNPKWIEKLENLKSEDICISSNVVVECNGGLSLRELKGESMNEAAPWVLESWQSAIDLKVGNLIK